MLNLVVRKETARLKKVKLTNGLMTDHYEIKNDNFVTVLSLSLSNSLKHLFPSVHSAGTTRWQPKEKFCVSRHGRLHCLLL